VSVEDVRVDAAQRAADRHAVDRGVLGRGQRPRGRGDRRLGRAIGVDQRGARAQRLPGGERVGRHRLATDEHQAQAGRQHEVAGGELGDEVGPERGGQHDHGELAGVAGVEEVGDRGVHVLAAQDQGGAGGERAEDLLVRDVERRRGELQQAVARLERLLGAHGRHVAGKRAVLDQHALGGARGAGGVDDVGQIAWPAGREVERVVEAGVARRRAGREHEAIGGREALGHAGRGEHHGDLRVVEHEAQPVIGVRRIERQERAAGVQHGDQRDDEIARALEADTDDDVGPHAVAAQLRGEPAGAAIELAVRERLVAVHDGDRVGRVPRVAGDQLVDARAGGPRGQRAAQRGHGELGGVDQRQLGQRALGRGDGGAQQRREVAGHALDGVAVEPRGVVLERADEAAGAVGRLGQGQGEIEPRGVVVDGERRAGQRAGAKRWHRGALEREHHVEQRRLGRAALGAQGLDEQIEGQALVLEAADDAGAGACQERAEARVARDIAAHDQGVDEEADQRRGLGQLAPADGHADGDVVLARVALEQREERGEQRGRGGHAFDLGQRAEAGAELGGEGEADALRARGLAGGVLDGQRDLRRHLRQLVAPVAHQAVERGALEPVSLPAGEVAVLRGEDRYGGHGAADPGVVERGQLVAQDAGGASVAQDVVDDDPEHVVLGVEGDERGAEQRRAAEVERLGGERAEVLLRLVRACLGGHGLEIEGDQQVAHEVGGVREPDDHAVGGGGERAAQHVVAGDDRGQRLREHVGAQRAGELEDQALVVVRAVGLELGEEPQPLLGERRHELARGHRGEGGAGGRGSGGVRGHRGGQRGEVVGLEDFGERERGAGGALDQAA
jgi:hypothetical protein